MTVIVLVGVGIVFAAMYCVHHEDAVSKRLIGARDKSRRLRTKVKETMRSKNKEKSKRALNAVNALNALQKKGDDTSSDATAIAAALDDDGIRLALEQRPQLLKKKDSDVFLVTDFARREQKKQEDELIRVMLESRPAKMREMNAAVNRRAKAGGNIDEGGAVNRGFQLEEEQYRHQQPDFDFFRRYGGAW